MSPRSAFTAAVLMAALAAVPARAQDPPSPPESQEPVAVTRESIRGGRQTGDEAPIRAPRAGDDNGAQEVRARVRPALDVPAPAAAPAAFDEQQGGRRNPSSGGGRSAGGGGGAQPRGGVRAPSGGRSGDGGRDTNAGQAVPRSRVQRPPQAYYAPSYARRYYNGGGGLGYYFYDPWSWYAGYGWPGYNAYGWNGYYGNMWGGYYGGGFSGAFGAYGGPYTYRIGGVRMKVDARDAEVYVDGYYAGIVDDFDGTWQQLRLDEGGYRIEVRKPGLTTLTFDVMIQPGRTITYRGRMTP